MQDIIPLFVPVATGLVAILFTELLLLCAYLRSREVVARIVILILATVTNIVLWVVFNVGVLVYLTITNP